MNRPVSGDSLCRLHMPKLMTPIGADHTRKARTIVPPPQFSDSDLPTVDAVIEEKRRQARAAAPPPPPEPSPQQPRQNDTAMPPPPEDGPVPKLAEELEEEAGQQGAFNPETGEINWDCPCLGGMAHGPCGEEFKAAFSCFVYSQEEPKGMDCIDKFQYAHRYTA
jgi:intermembrane space import and assembly protein 40